MDGLLAERVEGARVRRECRARERVTVGLNHGGNVESELSVQMWEDLAGKSCRSWVIQGVCMILLVVFLSMEVGCKRDVSH